MKFELNLEPLSINQAFQGRRFKTPKYNKWIKSGLWLLKPLKRQEKPYRIDVELYVGSLFDIDNALKPLFDLLKKGNIIEDDRYIEVLTIRKIISKEHKFIINFL